MPDYTTHSMKQIALMVLERTIENRTVRAMEQYLDAPELEGAFEKLKSRLGDADNILFGTIRLAIMDALK